MSSLHCGAWILIMLIRRIQKIVRLICAEKTRDDIARFPVNNLLAAV